MVRNIENKVHEIASVIATEIADFNSTNIKGLGVYNGRFGVLLFLSFYLSKYPDEKIEKIYQDFLGDCFEELSNGINIYTYCSGLAGILHVLKTMNENDLINIDFSDIENNYKEILTRFACMNIISGDYDFMHGGLGIPLYFIDDEDINEMALKSLFQTTIKDDDKMKWMSSLGVGLGTGFNIALSHGMSSIAVYLSRICKIYPKNDLASEMLTSTINYILSQKIDRNKYNTCFASQSLENGGNPHKGRLAWCYGDLGVGVALWQAGTVADNRDWKDIALDTYLFSAQKRDLADAMVRDAGICHGSAGIAMMFGYMYKETANTTLLNTRDYWIDVTMKFAFHKDGTAGYKKHLFEKDLKTSKWEKSYSLLDGVSGVGLVLMSVLYDDIARALNETMLLY